MTARRSALPDALLALSPFQAVARRAARRSLAVLTYHRIPSAQAFERQMELLLETRRPVDLETVLGALEGRPLPDSAALVTFDDLDRSVLENALPALRERGIPAVGFVVAGHLDSDVPFWWEEVEALAARGGRASGFADASPAELVHRLKRVPNPRRLAALDELRATAREPAPRRRHVRAGELRALEAEGLAIGSHTLSHPCLPCCSEDEIRREVGAAHDILASALGRPPRAFAYPNGDQDPRVVAAVARTGYSAAFLFDHRLCRWPPRDPLRISRLRTNPAANPHRFRSMLSGLHPFLHHAIGRD